MQRFTVWSSHGHLIVDCDTGVVMECISYNPLDDDLSNIIRFDVERFKKVYKTNTLPANLDILKLGYYQIKGGYEAPADGYEPEPSYSLCEAIADISFITAKENYHTDDSRLVIAQIIEWANDFEYLHRKIVWGINSPLDYRTSIYHFTLFKIKQWEET